MDVLRHSIKNRKMNPEPETVQSKRNGHQNRSESYGFDGQKFNFRKYRLNKRMEKAVQNI